MYERIRLCVLMGSVIFCLSQMEFFDGSGSYWFSCLWEDIATIHQTQCVRNETRANQRFYFRLSYVRFMICTFRLLYLSFTDLSVNFLYHIHETSTAGTTGSILVRRKLSLEKKKRKSKPHLLKVLKINWKCFRINCVFSCKHTTRSFI